MKKFLLPILVLLGTSCCYFRRESVHEKLADHESAMCTILGAAKGNLEGSEEETCLKVKGSTEGRTEEYSDRGKGATDQYMGKTEGATEQN